MKGREIVQFRFVSMLLHPLAILRFSLQLGERKASGRHGALPLRIRIGLVVAFVSFPFVYSTVSASSVQDQRVQHALLVSSQPAADQVLQSPPTFVHMWFSEALIPATSKALVVDTANRQVDIKDSHVNEGNGEEMDLTLPLLPAGTYVVVWQTQSAADGHVAGGSFLFRIARPDGTVPPIPAILPSGHVPGGGGIGVQSSGSLDGPSLLQTIATWIALLLFTFWVGGIIWEIWIFPPKNLPPFDHHNAVEQASQRWRSYTPYALVGILIANIGIIAGLAAELAGDWSGSVSLPLLRAILFESHFGTFWCLREGATLLALLFILGRILRLQRRQVPTKPTETATPVTATYPSQDALLYREAALIKVLMDIPHLPRHLIAGIRQCPWYRRIEGGLALILLFAFALSGHAAAVSSSALWAVIGIDLLHLLAEAAWIGGLLYISLVLLPTLNRQSNHDWADVLAIGLPRFSVIAITSVILLATTGSFNTTVHLTAFEQFWTTTYGRTLTIKIVAFLLMISISAYHAFFLRPRLAYALAKTKTIPVEAATSPIETATDTYPPPQHNEPNSAHEETVSPLVLSLGKRLEQWLRLEAMLGVTILLCVALLAAFAGSLTTSPPRTKSSQPTGSVSQTQTIDGYAITLKVNPATFGTNTFSVIVKNTQGQPLTGAGVSIITNMLDMDMGTETTQLQADPKQPGVYNVQADLNMGGHWEVKVRILPATSNNFVTATFDFSAA